MLDLEVVAADREDEAVAGPSQRVADVSPEEARGTEDGDGDARGLFCWFGWEWEAGVEACLVSFFFG